MAVCPIQIELEELMAEIIGVWQASLIIKMSGPTALDGLFNVYVVIFGSKSTVPLKDPVA